MALAALTSAPPAHSYASPPALALHVRVLGGAILTMLSTSMMPEAYEHTGRPVGLATTLGFAVAFGINWLS